MVLPDQTRRMDGGALLPVMHRSVPKESPCLCPAHPNLGNASRSQRHVQGRNASTATTEVMLPGSASSFNEQRQSCPELGRRCCQGRHAQQSCPYPHRHARAFRLAAREGIAKRTRGDGIGPYPTACFWL